MSLVSVERATDFSFFLFFFFSSFFLLFFGDWLSVNAAQMLRLAHFLFCALIY